MISKAIDFLLANANPSIKRRVKTEILHNLTSKEAAQYQEQILDEPIIKRIFACQKDNGWFGNGFHGCSRNATQFENMETDTKYLAEKAVDKDTPTLSKAMHAFEIIPLDDPCYEAHGFTIDEFKHAAGGQNLIRCACIARAGYDDRIDISPQIQLSLDSFRRVLEIDSIFDITRPIRNGKQLVFKDYEKWPCRYHLDILSHTYSWRSKKNIIMLAESIRKLMKTDRPELIGLMPSVWIGHAVGPLGGFPAQGFTVRTEGLLPGQCVGKIGNIQFEYMEWLARCGVVQFIPELKTAAEEIINNFDSNGICSMQVGDAVFKGWGPYGGLQLETDWKAKVRRDCDITFRALLIAYYSGLYKEIA